MWGRVQQILQCVLVRDVQTWFFSDGTVDLHNQVRNHLVPQLEQRGVFVSFKLSQRRQRHRVVTIETTTGR